MPILLVQFPKSAKRDSEHLAIQRYLKTTIIAIDAFDPKVKFSQPQKILKGIKGVILGGSAFNFASDNPPDKEKIFWQMVRRVKPFIQYLIEKDIPTLGICFGHQFLGYVLGAKVVNDKTQQETGSFSVYLTQKGKSNPLFSGLPSVFVAQFGHKDSLEKLPSGATLLAKTKKCKIAAFGYKKNIYGIQFHPELTQKDFISRLKLYPDYTGNKKIAEIKKRLKPSPAAPKIFKNFLKIIYAY